MTIPKVVTHAGLTVDLSQVKSFVLFTYSDIGKKNTLQVQFKTRYDFIQHPQTKAWEKQEYNESTEIEFPDYHTAKAYAEEWEEIWQDYLNEQAGSQQ